MKKKLLFKPTSRFTPCSWGQLPTEAWLCWSGWKWSWTYWSSWPRILTPAMQESSDWHALEQPNSALLHVGLVVLYLSHVISLFIAGGDSACVVTLYMWEGAGIPVYPMSPLQWCFFVWSATLGFCIETETLLMLEKFPVFQIRVLAVISMSGIQM